MLLHEHPRWRRLARASATNATGSPNLTTLLPFRGARRPEVLIAPSPPIPKDQRIGSGGIMLPHYSRDGRRKFPMPRDAYISRAHLPRCLPRAGLRSAPRRPARRPQPGHDSFPTGSPCCAHYPTGRIRRLGQCRRIIPFGSVHTQARADLGLPQMWLLASSMAGRGPSRRSWAAALFAAFHFAEGGLEAVELYRRRSTARAGRPSAASPSASFHRCARPEAEGGPSLAKPASLGPASVGRPLRRIFSFARRSARLFLQREGRARAGSRPFAARNYLRHPDRVREDLNRRAAKRRVAEELNIPLDPFDFAVPRQVYRLIPKLSESQLDARALFDHARMRRCTAGVIGKFPMRAIARNPKDYLKHD